MSQRNDVADAHPAPAPLRAADQDRVPGYAERGQHRGPRGALEGVGVCCEEVRQGEGLEGGEEGGEGKGGHVFRGGMGVERRGGDEGVGRVCLWELGFVLRNGW